VNGRSREDFVRRFPVVLAALIDEEEVSHLTRQSTTAPPFAPAG
jgi:hypothetical protein